MFYRFVFESISWLLVKGKIDRVIPIIKSIAKTNGVKLSEEACRRLEVTSVEKLRPSKDQGQNTHFFDAIKTPRLRRNIIFTILSWQVEF